jgi:predicted nuclease of restriction endonuclease-like (RecB) superfamily
MKKKDIKNQSAIYERIRSIIEESRSRALYAVNTEMVRAYWLIGREIVEEEQKGKKRAGYGEELIKLLAEKLTAEFGPGFIARNLWHMRNFYLFFPKLNALRSELTWTHYRLLMRVDDANARSFYEIECVKNHWSTRELERQINSLLFERLALSKDKKGLSRLSKKGQEIQKPDDLVKDPYILEFIGLKEEPHLKETALESGLIEHLKDFILELGKGFSFAARQKRITLDGDHFYIDLVFYNRLLRCFVLIDLKVGKLLHQDLGQMQMYVNYYDREARQKNENPPIGIVLCIDKNAAVVRYTLPKGEKRIFASKYKLYLPSKKELITELNKERLLLEQRGRLGD